MNVFAKFDEIPSMILEVIKETKRYGHTHTHIEGRTTQFAGGINIDCSKHRSWVHLRTVLSRGF